MAMNHNEMRAARVAVFEDTMAWIRENPALQQAVNASIDGTRLLTGNIDYHSEENGRPFLTVTRERTLSCAARLYQSNTNRDIAVLNFASASHPGGGVARGANAQEECLCRCSTLYPALRSQPAAPFYQLSRGNALHTDACIYTPGVVAIKEDAALPTRMEENEFFTFDVISCAAPNLRPHPGNAMNPGDIDPAHIADNDLFELHVRRWRQILRCAAGHADTLVLGAYGCGAFRKPPQIVAGAFRELMNRDPLLLQSFYEIVFAVYCPPQNDTNFRVFDETLADVQCEEEFG